MGLSVCLSVGLFSLISSCSLDYGSNLEDTYSVPEFVFDDVIMSRTEDGKETLSLHADQLEQYKDANTTYAKNVTFSTYDDNGKTTVEGECALIAADTDNEIYTLFDNVKITSFEHDIRIIGENLKWNNNTEQLTSGINDSVTVISDNFSNNKNNSNTSTFSGNGFSASGITLRYSFTDKVEGNVIQEDE